MKKLLSYLTILVSLATGLTAHDSFTQGDAYLTFKFDHASFTSLSKNSNFSFKGGFGKLNFKGDTKALRKQMLNTYSRYRSIHNPILEIKVKSLTDTGVITGNLIADRNPLYCFVYNKNYLLENRLIGFKYNEAWTLKKAAPEHKRFLLADWMYADNYKYAKQVQGLKATAENRSVSINTEDICLILISQDHLTRFKRRENMEGITVTRIENNLTTVYELESSFGEYLFKKAPNIEESSEFGKATEGGIFK